MPENDSALCGLSITSGNNGDFFISACDIETGESSAQAASRQAFLEKRNATLENFQPCRRTATTALASIVAESLCTTFQVPENYASPEDRQIDLKVTVLPALSDLPEPDPLVLLAGGPGGHVVSTDWLLLFDLTFFVAFFLFQRM